ncbi:MAG: ABC transporter ATP-binding protein [Propionibacteriaceae bacterium]|nr:ABC transporter ATP-binding protein [Propionibacteriaceae bacterium]
MEKTDPSDTLDRSVLAVVDLRFSYIKRGEELFSGLTHRFAPGALTVVTGPSGCGKSTLLYLLGLMLNPTSGQIEVDGRPVGRLSDGGRSTLRAARIGFVFQDSELDPSRTVVDSVIEPGLYLGRRVADLRPVALELLERFGLAHRADHRPGQVSGGQAQRVAVCRAMINQPDIVLADEPTGNLDRDNAALVLDALAVAAHDSGRTVVIASHDPYVIDVADRVVAL